MGKAKENWEFQRKIKYEISIQQEKFLDKSIKINVDDSAKVQLATSGVLLLCNASFREIGVALSLMAKLWDIYYEMLICWQKG